MKTINGVHDVYARVSTGQQTTENQRLELDQAGYQIKPDYWYADEGVSGKVAEHLFVVSTSVLLRE